MLDQDAQKTTISFLRRCRQKTSSFSTTTFDYSFKTTEFLSHPSLITECISERLLPAPSLTPLLVPLPPNCVNHIFLRQQSVELTAPVPLVIIPSGQSMQYSIPVSLLKVFLGQRSHRLSPITSLHTRYEPFSHTATGKINNDYCFLYHAIHTQRSSKSVSTIITPGHLAIKIIL